MFSFIEHSNEEEGKDSQIIIDNKYDIMMRYMKMRKLAVSYWDIFVYSFGYCLIFPIMNKLSHKQSNRKLYVFSNVMASMFFSYLFYKASLKYILKMFNKKDYDSYVTFCMKYQMEDDLLF